MLSIVCPVQNLVAALVYDRKLLAVSLMLLLQGAVNQDCVLARGDPLRIIMLGYKYRDFCIVPKNGHTEVATIIGQPLIVHVELKGFFGKPVRI